MQVHATGEYLPSVIIDSDAITRLWTHVASYTGAVSATVSCSDGIERRFTSLEELLSYENAARSAANTIELYGRSDMPARSITLTLGGAYGPRATLSIRGEEHEVTATRTRIMDSFSGMRAWYSFIATVDLLFFWTALGMGGLLLLQLMAPSKAPERPGRTFSEATQVLGYLLLGLAPICGAIYGISKLRGRFFPMVSMAFGQGAKRHNTDEQVRWSVLVSLVVGIVGSAIYAAISGA